ncbi:MAG TPA: hypothetical protein VK995_00260 [Oceanipulchritudo sp.]|nr:hypothetical protein [Oceanipulchritudo sp.]
MSDHGEYAIPLFALIDRGKLDLSVPLPESLGDHLGLYLKEQFGIESLSPQLLQFGDEPFLVLHHVPTSSLPALCSLVDVQRSQLYRYEREDEQSVLLTPLNVKI